MKRTLLLINLLLLSVCVFPQENIKVNYATIKKYVENQSEISHSSMPQALQTACVDRLNSMPVESKEQPG